MFHVVMFVNMGVVQTKPFVVPGKYFEMETKERSMTSSDYPFRPSGIVGIEKHWDNNLLDKRFLGDAQGLSG